MNIKSLIMEDIKGLNKSFTYKSSKDHSKWTITDNISIPWICIGDINRSVSFLVLLFVKINKKKMHLIKFCIHFSKNKHNVVVGQCA